MDDVWRKGTCIEDKPYDESITSGFLVKTKDKPE